MRRTFAASAAILLAAATASTAFARPATWTERQANASSRDDRQVCERSCASDYSPCDPLEYKLADGRCQNSSNGR